MNADTVDGLSAVKATSQKAKRKGKIVATDAKGFLPSNIVKPKWGLIADKPAFLADGVVGWSELAGIPAGFADGVDDVGTTGYATQTVPAEDVHRGDQRRGVWRMYSHRSR